MSKDDSSRRLIIGVGNPDRGDDGAGHAVVRALRDLPLPGIDLRTVSGEASQLIEAWAGADQVVVVDASHSGTDVATISHFDARKENLPATLERASTHGFGVAEAVALARNLDRLPAHLDVYAIEGANFEPGEGLTAEVAAATRHLARELADLARLPAPT